MDFAERASMAAAVSHDDRMRLVLVVEELFTNTVNHGRGAGAAVPVWLTLEFAPGEIRLTYEDAAPAFDPVSVTAEELDAPVASRRIGGLGIALIRAYARELRYERCAGRNRIVLVMACRI